MIFFGMILANLDHSLKRLQGGCKEENIIGQSKRSIPMLANRTSLSASAKRVNKGVKVASETSSWRKDTALPCTVGWWARARRPLAEAWDADHDHPFFAASKGRTAIDPVYRRAGQRK